jgi:hypothetical protein
MLHGFYVGHSGVRNGPTKDIAALHLAQCARQPSMAIAKKRRLVLSACLLMLMDVLRKSISNDTDLLLPYQCT